MPHFSSAVPHDGSVDLRWLVHDEGPLRDDRVTNLHARQDEQVRGMQGLERHASAAMEPERVFACHRLLAAVCANEDVPVDRVDDCVVSGLEIKGDCVLPFHVNIP